MGKQNSCKGRFFLKGMAIFSVRQEKQLMSSVGQTARSAV